MSRLTQHLSSQYFTAANALQSRHARQRIVAYVESYDDILFWRTVLNRFETDERYFEIMLPTYSQNGKNLLRRGKKGAITAIMQNTGNTMIACVDADYDYLMQRHTSSSRLMLDTPFVFHTVAYAIENMQCYADGLRDVTVMITLNDKSVFDFKRFMTDYSNAIWPLFLWSVVLYRHEMFSVMSISDMDHCITMGKMDVNDIASSLQRLSDRVSQKVKTLRRSHPELLSDIQCLKEELRSVGITSNETYLYIHGHHLVERIVLPLLTSVCKKLRRDMERQIQSLAVHSTQCRNELSCYNNSQEDILSMLKKSMRYIESEPFRRIMEQLRHAFG